MQESALSAETHWSTISADCLRSTRPCLTRAGRGRTLSAARRACPASSAGTCPQSRGSSCPSRAACASARPSHISAKAAHCAGLLLKQGAGSPLAGLQLQGKGDLLLAFAHLGHPARHSQSIGSPQRQKEGIKQECNAAKQRREARVQCSQGGAPLGDAALIKQQLVVRDALLLQRQHRPVREGACRHSSTAWHCCDRCMQVVALTSSAEGI